MTPDLSACAREPIHIPGAIQPHGILLVLSEPELRILQVSENTQSKLSISATSLLGAPLDALLPPEQMQAVQGALSLTFEARPRLISQWALSPAQAYNLVVHRYQGQLVLELERAHPQPGCAFISPFAFIQESLAHLEAAASWRQLCFGSAEAVRRLTGFDRVMIYRFDDDWHGTVVGEARDPAVDSYLDLRFPASDIPVQARRLYSINPVRLIPDASYTPVPLLPVRQDGGAHPLDLSFSLLRSVSPVHLEYLRNMGVAASMSISILKDGQLWGLIACHHREPLYPSWEVRSACELFARVLALQLAAREPSEDYAERLALRAAQLSLLEAMSRTDDFMEGLLSQPDTLLRFVDAQGAAICSERHCTTTGQVPDEGTLLGLIEWLHLREEPLFVTDSLAQSFPPAAACLDRACGLLALDISRVHKTFVLWFRPEVTQTVNWSGNPEKPATQEAGELRLHPRKSFDIWRETVHGHSLPWRPAQVDAARELREAILGIVLQKAERLAALSEELSRTNQELESFSYSVAHDLRAPFRHISGFSEMLQKRFGDNLDATGQRYIKVIQDAARHAGQLVDSLLAFSQLARHELLISEIDMDALLIEVRRDVMLPVGDRRVQWLLSPLPRVRADLALIRQVLHNLLANAIKYSGGRDLAVIEVGSRIEDEEIVYYIRDNGAGFDMQYVDKLFGVFQRLHSAEEFEGTGIGLANVRRIILRHGGRTWAEGGLDLGACFYFSLPLKNLVKDEEAAVG